MTAASINFAPAVRLDQTLAQAFPKVDPGLKPFGQKVLVQVCSANLKTKGGIILAEETRQAVQNNQQVAKVIDLGPCAFKNRDTLKAWPEGAWCEPGDFVRIPKFGGDRWEVFVDRNKGADGGTVVFALFDDLNILGKITCDPLDVIAFV